VKWVLRYLRMTTKLGLVFQRLKTGKPRVPQGYVDADYVGDLDQQRFTMGYLFTVAERTVSWKAELQDTVALSTIEAEYMTTVEASKKALWLRELVETFSIIHDSVRVYCDSQSATHLAKDHMYHTQTKHIDMRYHKIRQWVVDDKVIDLVKINTMKNPADMMIKTISVEKFRASLNFIKILQR